MQHTNRRTAGCLCTFISVFWILAATAPLSAQSGPAFGRLSVNAALGAHSVGFPFQNLLAGRGFALSSLGLEIRLNKSLKHSLFLASNTAIIKNSTIGNTVLFGSDLGYRFTSKSGVYSSLALGLGALWQSHTRETYRYDADSDIFLSANDKGKFASQVGGSIALGYDFSRKHGKRYAVFLKNQFFIQSPYFDVKAFPVMPQNIVQIGLNVKLNSLKKN
jgi:hypothetical protein